MTTVAEQIGALLGQLGIGHCFGVVGSGNFHVTTCARRAYHLPQPVTKAAHPPWPMPTHACQIRWPRCRCTKGAG